jgi:type IV pilus assembly protein PilE
MTMRKSPSRAQHGFTLIELMVAVAILAIIMAIAIPSYSNYVVRANRGEGKVAILQAAQALERCFTRHNAYNDGNCNVTFPISSEEDWYRVTVERTAATYTLTATPQGTQATRDGECASFTVTHTGLRGITGSGTVQDCW